jgi:CBS domain-containing protein
MEKIQHQHVTTVGEFMTTSVISVTSEMNIYQAIMFLVEHRISGAPVTNPDDRHELVGIISEKDCLLLLANGAYYGVPSGKVSDYMSRNVLTVDPARDVFAVADIFLKNNYRRLPVVENDKLIGIVTRGDVLRAGKRQWDAKYQSNPPDPGYLTDNIKSRLHRDGLPFARKKTLLQRGRVANLRRKLSR